MSVTFQQSVEFPGISAAELFRTYLSAQEHAAAIGAPVFINREVGSVFRAFGSDGVSGRNLAIVPERMIVQSWRGQPWQPQDLDSILVLTFEDTSRGGKIDLVHVNVPEAASEMINPQAWTEMYWKRWKAYFGERRRAKPAAKTKTS